MNGFVSFLNALIQFCKGLWEQYQKDKEKDALDEKQSALRNPASEWLRRYGGTDKRTTTKKYPDA